MPHWLIKSGLHRAISWMPRRQFWNSLFQEHITNSLSMTPDKFASILDHAGRHLETLHRFCPRPPLDFTVLEIGTGWYPIQPIALQLCGAGKIWTFDLEPLLTAKRLRTTLEHFCAFAADGRLANHLPRLIPERVASLRGALATVDTESPDRTLARLGVKVLIADAANSGLPEASIDFFFSYSVFQYLPQQILVALLTEFRRLARSGAVQSHHILPADQFQFFDRRLSPVDFLRYTNRQWRWLDSPLIPQTRLRISDYREAFAEAGWRITREENISISPEALQRVRLAPEFQKYSPEDLAVINTWLAAMKND